MCQFKTILRKITQNEYNILLIKIVMRRIARISLLFLIQLSFLGYSYSQNHDNLYQLNIIIKNLDGEMIKTAKVVVTQLKTGAKQSVSYSEDPGCYMVPNLDLGRVSIEVDNNGYDKLNTHHDVQNPKGSTQITLGKTNSKYYFIDSKKYPFGSNGEIVAIFDGQHDYTKEFYGNTKELFKENMRGNNVLVLRSGWYKFESVASDIGSVYLISTTKQQQRPLLADLRKLYPERPIGPLIDIRQDVKILLNSCSIVFNSDISENEIGKILQNSGATNWELINGYLYTVTFSQNSGIELLKVTEKLSLMKEVRSVSNNIFNSTYLKEPQPDD